jgi:hypothetical protein
MQLLLLPTTILSNRLPAFLNYKDPPLKSFKERENAPKWFTIRKSALPVRKISNQGKMGVMHNQELRSKSLINVAL